MPTFMKPYGLDEARLEQLRELESLCAQAEPLCMKMNWELLEKRPADETNDLLLYDGGTLIAWLGLYAFGKHPAEVEATGLVHPNYRRQGCFTRLYGEAVRESAARGTGRLLLIGERRARAAAALAEKQSLPVAFSELRRRGDTPLRPARMAKGVTLRPAGPGDAPLLLKLDTIAFGMEVPANPDELDDLFVAELGGRPVGKAGLIVDGEFSYVFGVVVLPELRGRGVGSAMLH